MLFRANSPEELDEIKRRLAADRLAPKTRILLQGGPLHGNTMELSPLEVEQGFAASGQVVKGKMVQGVYRPSTEKDVWRFADR